LFTRYFLTVSITGNPAGNKNRKDKKTVIPAGLQGSVINNLSDSRFVDTD
jgi:hypothetical protein